MKPNSNFILADEAWRQERVRGWIALLKREMFGQSAPLTARMSLSLGGMVPYHERESQSYQPVAEGDRWGETLQTAWFHLKGEVPSSWAGEKVIAELSFNNESTIYGDNGEPLQRLTEFSIYDAWYCVDTYPLLEACRGGEGIELWVHAFAAGINGVDRNEDPQIDDRLRGGYHSGVVKRLRLRTVRTEVRALYLEAETLFLLMQVLPEYSVRRARILRALMKAVAVYRDDTALAKEARACLATELARPALDSSLTARAIGHAHIDTGWLWRVEEGIRKCERTFASQLQLLDRYAHYVFGASSAQHYAFMQESVPGIFQRIKEQIAAERWEIQGAMWVESDTLLPSGESLIRQFLYGKNYFRKEFGVDVRHAWLPDVFGLTASFPQIMRQAGVDCLVTKKPHWNRRNIFPHTTFRWVGHDSSEVVVHILPQDRDYNGKMQADDLVKAEQGLVEKDRLDEFIYTYGVGDGGGGPTDLMVERAPYLESLEGVPRVVHGSVEGALDHFRERRDDLEKWVGEIYFEGHRGTYTTQGQIKRDNRRLEAMLRQIEFLYSSLPPEAYPREILNRTWKTLLLHQFHDILPGSGIREVYEDSRKSYDVCFADCGKLMEKFTNALTLEGDTISIFSSVEQTISKPIKLPPTWAEHEVLVEDGTLVPTQQEPGGTFILPTLRAQGFTKIKRGAASAAKAEKTCELVLENNDVRYVFERNGAIISIVHKASGTEFLAPGERGNVLSLYVDRPICWDAWDVDHLYQDELSAQPEVIAEPEGWSGPVRKVLRFFLKIGDSTLTQTCVLPAKGTKLDFETKVDWRERHRMLRVAFETNIVASTAQYEIQHGFIDRATHHNTSWEAAKFEAAALRYVNLSDSQKGLALLNNGKHGHKILHSTIDLNLLRSTTFPDYAADLGEHQFTYSLLPYTGSLTDSEVLTEATALNNEPLLFPDRVVEAELPFFVSGLGVSIEAIKRAEEGDDLILRIVESLGRPTQALIAGQAVAGHVTEVNVLEEPIGDPLALTDGELTVNLRAFEVRTLRFRTTK